MEDWTDANRVQAWRILRRHQGQLELCPEIGGQPIPPAPRIQHPALWITLEGQKLRFGGSGVHPLLARIRREFGPTQRNDSGHLIVPLEPKLAGFLLEASHDLSDVQFPDDVLAALARTAGP
jgi:hypothetical protein